MKCKDIILSVLGKYSHNGKYAFVLSYLHNRHRFPNLDNPKDLSELYIQRVLSGEINKIYYLADKYKVRDYIKEKGLEQILTPLIDVYDKATEIDFSKLPNKFALKLNYGAGMNIICQDKSRLNIEDSVKKLDNWLNRKVLYSYSEQHYNLIKRKIVCEEYIDDGSGGFPIDYKFMCICGKVHCILACSGRENGHADYLPYSLNWDPLYDYYKTIKPQNHLLPKPSNLEEMINIAEILSQDIDLVRVDLYSNGSKIWFGEMTLTPAGCIFHRWSDKGLFEMGQFYLNNRSVN